MSYTEIRTEKGVRVWDAGNTTRYQDADTGRWLSESDALDRLKTTGDEWVTIASGYDFSKKELDPIKYWSRRTEWNAVVAQPIGEVNWTEIQDKLYDIWDSHDHEYTHFYAGLSVVVSDDTGEGFETELKTLTMDTRTTAWPTSLRGDFAGKLELLFQWSSDYDSVFVTTVRTVGKVHTNA